MSEALKKLNPTAFMSGKSLIKNKLCYIKVYANNIMISRELAKQMSLNETVGLAFMPSNSKRKKDKAWDYYIGRDALGFELVPAKGGNEGCFYVNSTALVSRMCKDMRLNRHNKGEYLLFTAKESRTHQPFWHLGLESKKQK